MIASFTQFPLRLAWALTIHKAQGQTYKSVEVDLEGGAFDSGQTYTALSRCVSLNNLYLAHPIDREDIIVNQEIIDFMGTKQDLLTEAKVITIDEDKERKRAELLRQLAELDAEDDTNIDNDEENEENDDSDDEINLDLIPF